MNLILIHFSKSWILKHVYISHQIFLVLYISNILWKWLVFFLVFACNTIFIGDDCIAINGNSAHINITGINCGPGHGIRFVEGLILQYNLVLFLHNWQKTKIWEYKIKAKKEKRKKKTNVIILNYKYIT